MAKKQTKRTRRRRAARPPAPQNTLGLISATRQVCSVTNPFCDAAKGAKWPDGGAPKSVTTDFVSAATFSTDAAGHLSVICISDLYPFHAVGTVNAGGTNATFNAITPFPGGQAASDSRYRITSIGYKISCLSTRMNTQGMLRLRLLSAMNPFTLKSIDPSTPHVDQVLDVPLSRLIERDIYVTIAAVGPEARLFRSAGTGVPIDIDALITREESLEWQTLVASVLGGEISSSCLEISCYQHYERIYPDGNGTMIFATPPVRANQSYMDAAINTSRSIGGFLEGAAKKIDDIYHSRAAQILLNSFPQTRGANRAIMTARSAMPMIVD